VLKKKKKGCNGKDFNVYMFCKLGIDAARLGLPPALRVTHAAVFICVRGGAILRFFVPQGRHAVSIGVTFGVEESTESRLHAPRCRGGRRGKKAKNLNKF